MRCPRQGRNVGLSVRRQKSLAAKCLQQFDPVAVPHLSLTRGLARAGKKPELFLVVEVALLPPAAQGRQVVAANNGKRQCRIGRGWQEHAGLRLPNAVIGLHLGAERHAMRARRHSAIFSSSSAKAPRSGIITQFGYPRSADCCRS
jgi:hypothetical protein